MTRIRTPLRGRYKIGVLGKGVFAVRVSGLPVLNLGLRELLERGVLIASLTPAHNSAEPNAHAALAEVTS